MNYQSRVRGVLWAALVPLLTCSVQSVRGQQPADYGAYSSAPPLLAPQGLPAPEMRPPTRAYSDYPPPSMNNPGGMMPAGGAPGAPVGPAMGPSLGSMPPTGPMPSPLPTGPMPTGPMPSGPLPMMNGAMPGGGSPTGPMPTMVEPPYSTYPMTSTSPSGCASGRCGGGYATGGCANGTCGAGGCATGMCGSGGCDTGCSAGSSSPTGMLANLYGLIGFDGARTPEDLGINANVGGRAGVGTVVTLLEDAGLAMQFGYAANYHATATAFQRMNGGPGERTQQFTTIGLFQRTCSGFLWGVAYDYVHTNSYDHIDASQWRGQVGWKVDSCNEFGVWGTHHDRGDTVSFAGESFHLRSIDMAAIYYTRYWSCAMTRVWAGIAERHGRSILGVFPDAGPTDQALIYGAEFLVPLSPCVSLYGEANFVTPYDSGVVSAFVGVALYPAATANQIPRSRFAPMFSIANNATFALDARRN